MKLSILIPVLNEEKNIPLIVPAVTEAFQQEPEIELEIVFVDDGSRDSSYSLLSKLADTDSRIKIVRFSRNFGSHAALLAAFQFCSGNAAVYLAADLQDPPVVLGEMVKKWREGYHVVWGQREQRDEPLFSKAFAWLYYRAMRRFALPEMPPRGLDLCMIDRLVIDTIVSMREKNTALFGLILWSGFPQAFVTYQRSPRKHGKSNWTLSMKIKLVVDSLVAFSFAPIRLVTYLGISFSIAGFIYGLITVIRALMGLTEGVPGWASVVTIVIGLSGVQLLMLGVVAEYLWRTFDETRNRPPFVVREAKGFPAQEDAPRQVISGLASNPHQVCPSPK